MEYINLLGISGSGKSTFFEFYNYPKKLNMMKPALMNLVKIGTKESVRMLKQSFSQKIRKMFKIS